MSAVVVLACPHPGHHRSSGRDLPSMASLLMVVLLQLVVVTYLVRRFRARRRAFRMGLRARPGDLWVVTVEYHSDAAAAPEGGVYRAPQAQAIGVRVGGQPRRTVPLSLVRAARLVRDPKGRWAPRLDDTLVVSLPGEELVIPCAAEGFDMLVTLLRRRRLLSYIDIGD